MALYAPLARQSVIPEHLHRQGNTVRAYATDTLTSGGADASGQVAVRVVATANIALSGAATIDGTALATGDRVLPTAQTTGSQNRVAIVDTAGAWSFDTSISYAAGLQVNIIEGTAGGYRSSTWQLATTGAIVPGTTALVWEMEKGAVPDGSITPAKLSFDPATQTELDAHAGTVASTTVLGHVKVDGVTTTLNGSNQLVASGGGDITVRAVVTGYDFSGNSEVPNGVPSSSVTDGVTVSAGQKVLVYGESDQTYNGTYIVAAGNWTRSDDTIAAGVQVQAMSGGTAFSNTIFTCTNTGAITIGTTNITFGTARATPPPNSVNAATIIDGSVGTAEMAADSVTDDILANMPAGTVKGRADGAGTGNPGNLTGTQLAVIVDAFTGDSGSGGLKGQVPAPAAGDQLKYLRGDGTFANPPSGAILSVLLGTTGLTVPAGATRYIGVGQAALQTTEANAITHLPRAGTASDMLVVFTGTQPADGNLVITTRIGLAGTGLLVNIPNSTTTGLLGDAVNNASGLAQDELSFELMNLSTSTSIAINEIHICY